MANEKDKQRAAAMKAGPNTIVSEVPGAILREVVEVEEVVQQPIDQVRELEPMSLDVFLVTNWPPHKFDQAAGFAHHAKGMAPRTIHLWREAFDAFMKKPIR